MNKVFQAMTASTGLAYASQTAMEEQQRSMLNNPHFMLLLGRLMLVLACAGILVSIAVAYIYSAYFSIPVQVFWHLALPISAGFFKLGYVVRLAAHHALGNCTAG